VALSLVSGCSPQESPPAADTVSGASDRRPEQYPGPFRHTDTDTDTDGRDVADGPGDSD
jgi:hypothetical protein